MKRCFVLLLVLMAIPLYSQSAKSDPPKDSAVDPKEKADATPPSQLTPLMRMKLEKGKNILEGLAMEDYELIAKNARSLKLLSLESGWNVFQTEEYATQSRDFRRTCDLIAKAADNKDVGRAALGYVALTVRCVECHAYMRQHKVDLAKRDSN